jgi:hypothetical protein
MAKPPCNHPVIANAARQWLLCWGGVLLTGGF